MKRWGSVAVRDGDTFFSCSMFLFLFVPFQFDLLYEKKKRMI